jgi:hypothetical protein
MNDKRRARYEQRQRLIYLAERPDYSTNPRVQEEWKKLREEVWVKTADKKGKKGILVEVVYDGEVIYTGNKRQVVDKCKISFSSLNKRIRDGNSDKLERYYRIKQ